MKNNIIILLVIASSYSFSQDRDLFSVSNTIKYANYLYGQREYQLAIPEYKRLTFLDSGNFDNYYRLVMCYRYINNYRIAISYMDTLFPDFSKMPERFAIEYLTNNLLAENYPHIISLLSTSESLECETRAFFSGISYIHLEHYAEAESILLNCPSNTARNSQLYDQIKNYTNSKRKIPAVAITLSAIVPGSGKVYAGYWKDGLIAFSFVALSAWQCYRGFSKNGINSAYGWIYGTVSVSFYLGNLFGSGKAANVYNMNKKESFHKNVKEIYMHNIN
jgi:hypothetical protein